MAAKKILVVEDNALNMKLVRSLLIRGGYSVIEAGDAETGIALAQEQHPDLILMDIQLPGMDGLSATQHIRSEADLKDIPIVALTSYAMQEDVEKTLKAGCTGHISKPIDTRRFLDVISAYMSVNRT